MRCLKHGCVITETITDDVFCGVCRTVEKDARIAKLEELLQFYAGVKAYGWDANGQYHDDLSIPAREALHIGL